MSTPHLRVLPNPTADAMRALGETPIAGVLGTYDELIGQRNHLFKTLMSIDLAGADRLERLTAEDAMERVCRRLRLYCEMAAEVGQ